MLLTVDQGFCFFPCAFGQCLHIYAGCATPMFCQDVLARMGNQTFMSLIDAAPTRELLCSRVSDFMGTPK